MSSSAAPKEQAGSSRRPTNVTLPDNLLREARALGINLSQACERGLAAEVGSGASAALARGKPRRHGGLERVRG